MTKGQAAYSAAMKLLKDNTADFLDLAEALRRLQDVDGDEYRKAIDSSSVGSRKAYYLVAIDRAFSGLSISKDRLRKIGWTKLKVLTDHVNKENYAALLKLAEQHTAQDLERVLSGQESMAGANVMNLRFKPEHYAEVYAALLKHGAIPAGRGLEGKEDAVLEIVRKVMAK